MSESGVRRRAGQAGRADTEQFEPVLVDAESGLAADLVHDGAKACVIDLDRPTTA
jgi:hypothetical protein